MSVEALRCPHTPLAGHASSAELGLILQDDGTLLTLFIFDATLPPLQPGNKDRRTLMQLAKNALKKLRTIRHPDVCVVPSSDG